MNKLIATLVAATFAMGTAFAATPAKVEAPAAPAKVAAPAAPVVAATPAAPATAKKAKHHKRTKAKKAEAAAPAPAK
jgi:hypothetical protein